MEVHNIVQDMVTKTISKKNKCNKAKWLSEETFQRAKKRRRAKGKRKRKGVSAFRHTQLNAEFQGIAEKNKNAFLSEKCKEIEKNNIMENTRDLFKKIKDTKGTTHAKTGTVKGRNCKDVTEGGVIKNRCNNTQKNYTRKVLMTQITMMV